ncbi:MAG: hypothetical protein ACQEP9_00785 [Bacillota bacterium]
MADEIQRHDDCDKRGFDSLLDCLEKFDCKRVVIVVKAGGSCGDGFCCCRQEGLVCDVNRECGLVILLDDEDNKIFIPVDAIAAVIKEKCCC